MLTASEKDIAQAALAPGPHAIISPDRDGVIRDWNLIAERIFGIKANDAIGQSLDLVIPVEEPAIIGEITGVNGVDTNTVFILPLHQRHGILPHDLNRLNLFQIQQFCWCFTVIYRA